MDTRDTAEQAELRRAARQLARELGPNTVADLDDATRAKRLAGAVRDAGWWELRDNNGDGAPLASGVEAAIVADALGAAAADVAYTGVVLAGDLLRRAGGTRVDGDVVAFSDSLVEVATGAPAIAVDCTTDSETALVAAPSAPIARARVSAPLAGADLTRVVREMPAGTASTPVPGVDALTADDLTQWRALGLALTSADLVGVMRGVIDLTVTYAADRKQFDVPVGSFQAVQHLLAEAHTLCEGAQSAALYAAWAVDDLAPDAALNAGRVAKAYAARAARTVCETAIQVHGGIGNTWDCMAHVFLRRALLSTQWFGDDGTQLQELAHGLS
jgi:alkylation response protein AidB-like acyl-CoA dehydrogenase